MNNWVKDYTELFGPLSQPKPEGKVLTLPVPGPMTLADYAISTHVRNLYATYGEDVVKQALAEQFGLVVK